MRKLLFLSIFLITYANADIPSMYIPTILYAHTRVEDLESTNTSDMIQTSVRQKLPAFNADVRGEIIKSGRFKVVKMPKKYDALSTGLQNGTMLTKLTSDNTSNNTIVNKIASSPKDKNKLGMPDYILRGVVAGITQTQDTSPVKDTDKITNQYNINVAVNYKLIKTSDRSVMASFIAYGHASDVKILTNGSSNQVLHHNVPKLIKEASKNLAKDVVDQLYDQFGMSSENYNNGSRVVTDVKIYKN
jgi:hypothetical protein